MKKCHSIFVALLLGVFCIQSIYAQTDSEAKPQEKFSCIEKVITISAGAFFGGVLGLLVGAGIGNSRAYEGDFTDMARGWLIGASIFPFMMYEERARKKGAQTITKTWHIVSGLNTTFSNYGAARYRPGYSLGIVRSYHWSDKVRLQGEVLLSRREFFLPLQRIHFQTPGTNQLWHSDIDFSVVYLDLALLTRIRIGSFEKAKFNVILGPALSVQVLEKTNFHIREREYLERDERVAYDFGYIDDEPGPTSPYFGLVTAIELEVGKLLLKTSLHRAFTYSNQIFPLSNETRLTTLTFSLGYKFSKK